MEYFPDKSLAECYAASEELLKAAQDLSHMMAEDDGYLAEMLTVMLISQQNATMIFVHRIDRLEKKIDSLLSKSKYNKRFDIE